MANQLTVSVASIARAAANGKGGCYAGIETGRWQSVTDIRALIVRNVGLAVPGT